jgi:hypothetical protein
VYVDVPFDLDDFAAADQAMLVAGQEVVTPQMAKQSIDDLVADALRYRDSTAYAELLRFIGGFRRYSPFNALLIHAQMEGAAYVAPASHWASRYARRVRPGERPIVVLQPFGPVLFVFDVSQTDAEPDAPPLPQSVVNPFAMPPLERVQPALGWALENAKADGVRVQMVSAGSQSAGCISLALPGSTQRVVVKQRPEELRHVPIRFETRINRDFDDTERYATLAHELAHLYCGHLGSEKDDRWPDRARVEEAVAEFEAESAAFIACRRLDDDAAMPPHLAQYLDENPEVPEGISLERVAAAAGAIAEMSLGWVKPRKRKE